MRNEYFHLSSVPLTNDAPYIEPLIMEVDYILRKGLARRTFIVNGQSRLTKFN